MRIPLVNREGVTTAWTVVDDDMAHLAEYRWYENSDGYAMRREPGQFIRMHRVVLGLGDGDPIVDHINGDRLDNRRANLRRATKALNALNTTKTYGASGIRGVNWHKKSQRWRGYVTVEGKHCHLGFFDTKEAAEVAVVAARAAAIAEEAAAA